MDLFHKKIKVEFSDHCTNDHGWAYERMCQLAINADPVGLKSFFESIGQQGICLDLDISIPTNLIGESDIVLHRVVQLANSTTDQTVLNAYHECAELLISQGASLNTEDQYQRVPSEYDSNKAINLLALPCSPRYD